MIFQQYGVGPISIKIGMVAGVDDAIIRFNFFVSIHLDYGVLYLEGGQKCPFPIDFGGHLVVTTVLPLPHSL